MQIVELAKDDIQVLCLKGKLDSMAVPAVEKAIQDALQRSSLRVLLDLSGVDFISSAGLRVVLASARQLAKRSGVLACCAATPAVARVFELAGLGFGLSIYDSEQDALTALAADRPSA
ncbi:MAG TPA: STAS domain-containing protein [Candidatus Brocadiia bacterium]|nr:STAS domain-containing protein [Candidatus Brocadiia bacterium]